MAKKSQGPAWFKLWLHHRPLLDAVPDEVVGRVIKASLHYFATGETVPLGQLEIAIFSAIRADIDEANADYQRDVENGRKGGRPKGKEKPPVTGPDPPVPTVREGDGEEEREGEREAEEEGEGIQAVKPPACRRFIPPSAEEVKQYCREQGYSVDAERFVDHYESNGWMVGRNKMKNWKASVRNWSRKEKVNGEHYGKTEADSVWAGIGTVV